MREQSSRKHRVLWITDQWPVRAPSWGHEGLELDLLVLGEESRYVSADAQANRAKCLRLGRLVTWAGRMGFSRTQTGLLRIDSAVGLQNEELRRWFRDFLSESSWDACVLDGLAAAAPLLGDHGLEVPRSLSYLVYRPHRAEAESWREAGRALPVHKALWARVQAWRLSRIERTILERVTSVLDESENEQLRIELWRPIASGPLARRSAARHVPGRATSADEIECPLTSRQLR